jgi:predicted Zn-dependent peptidase
VFRARNTYWNELLERDAPIESSRRIANQAAYLGRLIDRTEVATRISNMTPNYLQNIASKWFWDVETCIYAWGPLHNIMVSELYGRRYRRATLGEYSIIKVKVPA